MDRAIITDDETDMVGSTDGLPEEGTARDSDPSSARDRPLTAEQEWFKNNTARLAYRAPNAIRSTQSFAQTLRPRPLVRIGDEIFEQIAVERSSEAYSEFYEGIAPKIFSFIFRLLHDEDDALDVLQDTFTEIWKRAPVLYNIHTNLAAWALHLARNFSYDMYRSKHYKIRSTSESYDPSRHGNLMLDEQTPERNLTMIEARDEIKNAIEKLNPEQRKSIELVFFSDLTQKAAAEKLHLTYGRFQRIYYESLTELEYELFPYLRKKPAPAGQKRVKRAAVERKKEAVETKQDAAARAEVLRKYLLGLPFADERDVL